MKAAHIDASTQAPTVLTYTDSWGEQEYIFAREGLCSRAGCKCVFGILVCNNFEYVFFSRVVYNWYANACLDTCTCRIVRASAPQSIGLGGGGKNVSVNVIASRERDNVNTVN